MDPRNMTARQRDGLRADCERIVREMDVKIVQTRRQMKALQAELDEYERRKRDAEAGIGYLTP